MNFLQLCQALRRECEIPGTGPSSVAGQTGEFARLVNWIAQSWLEISLLHQEWRWLRRDVTFNTVAGQRAYLPTGTEIGLTDFAARRRDLSGEDGVWRRYILGNPGSENYLSDMDYASFKAYWEFASRRTEQSEPINITVRPYDNALLLGALPNSVGYTIVGEYFAAPTELVNDADTPAMPPRFHMAIVYLAMTKYGANNAAGEIYSRGETEYKRMLSALELDQLDGILGACPLE